MSRTMHRNLFSALVAGTAIMFAAGTARAQDPAALVTDVTGSVEPEVFAFDELMADSVYELGEDGMMTFSHYDTCSEVTVTGGTLRMIDIIEFETVGGQVDVAEGECTETVEFSSDSADARMQPGAFTLRATDTPPDRTIVVFGETGMTVSGITLVKPDGERVQLSHQEGTREFVLPGSHVNSDTGARFEMTNADGEVVFTAEVPDSAQASGTAALLQRTNFRIN